MKPICVACSRFYRPEKTGYYFLEGMPGPVPSGDDSDNLRTAVPGLSEAAHWSPYKLWCGDLWRCPGCGHQIISGVGREPVAEHYEKDFAEQTANPDLFQVNDC